MPQNALNRLKSYAEDIFNNKAQLIRILLIVFILMLALILRIHESSKADITVDSSSADTISSEICVDIGGAVVSPGVYTVKPHTRLYEVIEMAGGLISNADTDSINRAEFVEDGEKIIIPVRSSVQDYLTDDPAMQPDMSGNTSTVEGASSDAYQESSRLVNINYASREELMSLPGIGEAKADRIIEYRTATRFRKKEDIKSVNGIGDSIYSKLKDLITV